MKGTMEHREGGFALCELLTALLLISLCLSIFTGAIRAALGSYSRLGEELVMYQNMVEVDTQLRELISEIRAPYWEGPCSIGREDRRLVLPWFRGVRDDSLIMEISPSGLFRIIIREKGVSKEVPLHPSIVAHSIRHVPPSEKGREEYHISLGWKKKEGFIKTFPPTKAFPGSRPIMMVEL